MSTADILLRYIKGELPIEAYTKAVEQELFMERALRAAREGRIERIEILEVPEEDE